MIKQLPGHGLKKSPRPARPNALPTSGSVEARVNVLFNPDMQNQVQALQMTLLITLPSILMSGFVFPRETMPGPLYLLSDAIPVTFYLEIIRGIVVRGAGFMDLWPSVLALLIITTILLTLAATRFRKRMG